MTYLQKRFSNKYGAKKSTFQGKQFDSKFEVSVAEELTLRKLAKDIKDFETQKTLQLYVNDYHICDYRIDFVIENYDGSREFLESKGFETPEWRIKWKLFEAVFDKDFRKHPLDKMTVVKQQTNCKYLKQKYGKLK